MVYMAIPPIRVLYYKYLQITNQQVQRLVIRSKLLHNHISNFFFSILNLLFQDTLSMYRWMYHHCTFVKWANQETIKQQ